jgi:hybrid cluster-associated redox disulfide protein
MCICVIMDAGSMLERKGVIVRVTWIWRLVNSSGFGTGSCPAAFFHSVASKTQCLQETFMEASQCEAKITADCLVDQVIRRHPQTIAIFVSHGLQCAGCLISPYHTIADSAREYQVRVEPLLGELNRSLTVA